MNSKYLKYLLSHCSNKSLLIIDFRNKLVEIKCPFYVVANYDVGKLKKDQRLIVNSIKLSKELKVVYVISGGYYHYYHFSIRID